MLHSADSSDVDVAVNSFLLRSGRLRLENIAWDQVAAHPLCPDTVRALRYMLDIESHTLVYMRDMLASRAIDDPEIGPFLAAWLYEETFHGIAFDRFLRAAGHPVARRQHGKETLSQRAQSKIASMISKTWTDFITVQMLWGAINELTTMLGYQRLAILSGHPVLRDLLAPIAHQEARHFSFYFQQAGRRLTTERKSKNVRAFIKRFWAPVGSGVQPAGETRFITTFLFSGPDGLKARERIDATIGRLPGFEDANFFGGWFERNAAPKLIAEAA